MGDFIMNATTLMGGVFGLLIGVVVFFLVFLILGLPYVLMTRRPETQLDHPKSVDSAIRTRPSAP